MPRRTQWPTIRDFDTAGNRALYLAVGHYGGVDYWAERMGLSRRHSQF